MKELADEKWLDVEDDVHEVMRMSRQKKKRSPFLGTLIQLQKTKIVEGAKKQLQDVNQIG